MTFQALVFRFAIHGVTKLRDGETMGRTEGRTDIYEDVNTEGRKTDGQGDGQTEGQSYYVTDGQTFDTPHSPIP